MTAIFNYDDPSFIALIKTKVNAPYIHTEVSTLGGKERASIILKVSLDPKSSWPNSILHNSRYFMISISRDGTMELFAKYFKLGKMRKTKVTSIDKAIDKINQYIALQK
jgi:hypothetical protein